MSRSRRAKRIVTWAGGPRPKPGDAIRFVAGGSWWLLTSVAMLSSGKLAIGVARAGDNLPPGTVRHGREKVAPVDPSVPCVRQIAGSGPTAAMRARWRDPSDTTPGPHREQKTVAGLRQFCALRRATPGPRAADRLPINTSSRLISSGRTTTGR